VPKPRAHQIRYHGVFAPASPDRARVVPRTRAAVAGECGEASVTDRQRALTWAQRLKRVFAIEIETCRRCGGRLRVIASIEAPSRCRAADRASSKLATFAQAISNTNVAAPSSSQSAAATFH